MKNVINRAFMAKKKILFVLAAVCLFAASSWAQVDPCATVTDTVTVTFKLDDGSLTGNFSVAYDGGKYKKVSFSKGNLQYTRASTGVDWSSGQFSFMEHQYDVVETSNVSASYANETAIGLFGWATSGDSRAGTTYQPWATVDNNGYGSSCSSGEWNRNYCDWGYVNPIVNGGNTAGKWRVLTYNEWKTLLGMWGSYDSRNRPNAANLRTLATVNSVPGIILLPDDWSLPAGQTMTITTANFTTDVYTEEQWNVLEAAGAVFLPAAGKRVGGPRTTLSEKGGLGDYWTSYMEGNGYAFQFRVNSVGLSFNSRSVGYSVRLVKDVTE